MNDERFPGLDTLPTPAPAPGFWDALHEQLILMDTAPETDPQRLVIRRSGSWQRDDVRPRWGLAIAAAILVAVALVSVYALERRGNVAPAERRDGVISDPRSIDIDPWRREDAVPLQDVGGPYQVFDLSQLPTGWSVNPATIDGEGYDAVSATADVDYRWFARLMGSDGTTVSLDVVAPPAGRDPSLSLGSMVPATTVIPDDTPFVVHGQTVLWLGDGITWAERGVVVRLTFSQNAAPAAAIELAEALVPVEADTLGLTLLSPAVEPDDPLFAGTVDGVRWWVAVESSFAPAGSSDATVAPDVGAPIATSVTADGILATIAVDGVSVSSATAQGAISGDSALNGHGRLYVGRTEAPLDSMRLVLSDGRTVTLPVVHDGEMTWFAVPVPVGLDVATLDYLDADGSVLRSRHLPPAPDVDNGAEWNVSDPLG